jgi:hypothetical protein
LLQDFVGSDYIISAASEKLHVNVHSVMPGEGASGAIRFMTSHPTLLSFHRAAEAAVAISCRRSGDSFSALALPPANLLGTAPYAGSSISPVAIRATINAAALVSANRFWPFGPTGISTSFQLYIGRKITLSTLAPDEPSFLSRALTHSPVVLKTLYAGYISLQAIEYRKNAAGCLRQAKSFDTPSWQRESVSKTRQSPG